MDDKKFKMMTSSSKTGPGDAGRTGSWRVERPVIELKNCTPAKRQKASCFLCWLYCPDGVISKELEPQINLEYCKGCGICAQECPTGAIEMVEETRLIEEERKSNEKN